MTRRRKERATGDRAGRAIGVPLTAEGLCKGSMERYSKGICRTTAHSFVEKNFEAVEQLHDRSLIRPDLTYSVLDGDVMEAPKMEASVLSEIWRAKIPIRLSLKHCGVPDPPLPFYAELPRFAYLPFLFHDAIQFFARSTVEAVKHNPVFEFEGVMLPWHIPVGILYDLLSEEQVPWTLTVSFVSAFPCDLLPWEDEDEGSLIPLKKLFKNTLKETAYILKGSDGSNCISQMDLESTEALWQSSRRMDLKSYEQLLSTLEFSTEVTSIPRQHTTGNPFFVGFRNECGSCQNPPAESFLSGRQVLRWKDDVLHLSRPVESEATLLKTFQKFFPSISWDESTGSISPRRSVEDITNENACVYLEQPIVKTCSFIPDLKATTFGWLHRNMHAPDNFLYIVIIPKECFSQSLTGGGA